MTPAATRFVTPLTFETLSGNPVVTDLWGGQRPGFELPPPAAEKVRGKVEHVDVAESADCVVIAPATADLMARLVHGEAPDALTATVLATPAPLVICPAMDVEMWRRPATRANVRALRARGARMVGPDDGELASGLSGPGRLAETAAIVAEIERAVRQRRSMSGLRVLVGAGRTEEPLDPVRVLSNRSSGRMGFALAEAARDRGAEVTVVSGVTSVEPPHGVRLVPAGTAIEMERAMRREAARADVVLMAAAVADYRPARVASGKIKRESSRLSVELVANPDILAGLSSRRRRGQILVGFALETSDGLRNARAKLAAKGVDLVVLNSPRAGLGGDTNRVTLVEAEHHAALPVLPKREVAERLLERVLALREARAGNAKAKARPVRSRPRPRAARRAARSGG